MTQGGDAHGGAVTALAPALVLDLGAAVILPCRAGGRTQAGIGTGRSPHLECSSAPTA